MNEAVSNGWIGGDGPYTKKTQEYIENNIVNCKKALLTTSCTHALEMSAILLNLKLGDEVIVPSYTFVSTALAFMMHGAKVVFADVKNNTFNIDEDSLEGLISSRTRAIVVVHYAGIACNMDKIMSLSKKYKLVLIEDNAHGLYGEYKGKPLGSFGDFATQSFHETKNFTCGEGGALLINNDQYIDRAEIIREKGTDRSKFFRGEIDKYTWIDKGSSYVLSDILAAFLLGQLESSADVQKRRKSVICKYISGLEDWALLNNIQIYKEPENCTSSYHMFYIMMPTHNHQIKMLFHLKNHGISATFHYIPLHTSNIGHKLGYKDSDLPVSLDISKKIIRLPVFGGLLKKEVDFIIRIVKKYKW